MGFILIYFGILGAILAGAMSPGPSFIWVSQVSIKQERASGLMASAGMATGGAIFSLFALLGLTAIIHQVPSIYLALKLVGGLYLIYLAIKIWQNSVKAMDSDLSVEIPQVASLQKLYWQSLFVQVSNPKTSIVYATIFTAFLPQDAPTMLLVALVPGIFFTEFLWYAFVVFIFSQKGARRIYLKAKRQIDRVFASLLAVLGIRLLANATIK